MSVTLNTDTLTRLGNHLELPLYERRHLRPTVVHIGVGNFHRAHQAEYLHQLLNMGVSKQGIIGIDLVNTAKPIAEIFSRQDGLYTLSSVAPSGKRECSVIGSIVGYMDAQKAMEEALATVSQRSTTLVTLTITEKGYCINAKGDSLDWEHPAIVHDLTHPGKPQSAIGFLVTALYKRFVESKAPLTIISCDNIPSNGKLLRRQMYQFVANLYPSMSAWLDEAVTFPSTMVDRITPVTTQREVDYIEERYKISDMWPVRAESFKQWVIEHSFSSQIPDYSQVGVLYVQDVKPYEEMKISLLNGSHSALAYLAYLLGYRAVDEAMGDKGLATFIRRSYMEQVGATLAPVAGIDVDEYKESLIARFKNKFIGDSILRLASDGSKKIPIAIIRPLLRTLSLRSEYSAITLALAGWARFLSGFDEQGNEIPIDDPQSEALHKVALQSREHPEEFFAFLGVQEVRQAQFRPVIDSFSTFLTLLYRQGSRATIREYLQRIS